MLSQFTLALISGGCFIAAGLLLGPGMDRVVKYALRDLYERPYDNKR